MKKTLHYLILILALQCCALAQAQWQNGLWVQKQAYNWYFGDHAGITFNSSPPTAITDSAIAPGLMFPQEGPNGPTLIEGAGSISDANGNTLMYTNGQTVWNADNEVMQNGTGLLGDVSSLQLGLIVPNPGNTGKYYIFTIMEDYVVWGLYYSEVDINMDGGLGAVTENKNIQLTDKTYERISAVHHADGHQVWVVNNSHLSNEIQAFLVSDEGVSTTPVTSEVGIFLEGSAIAQMKFSPDGTKIAIAKPYYEGVFYIDVYNFDRATGKATDLVASINMDDIIGSEMYGCGALEFSPDSRFLYAGGFFNGTIYQFDLQAGPEQAIKDSGILIGTSLFTLTWAMQLAPDGKIYITKGDFGLVYYDPYVGTQSKLDVINFPNNPGLAAGYAENGIDLANGRNDFSIPVFIQSYLASGLLYEGNNCFGEEISFNTLRIAGITDIAWDFGDPASGANNSATGLDASHIFSAPGTYTVTAVITSNGALQTTTTQVTILAGPHAILPSSDDLIKCANVSGNAIYNLTGLDTGILAGQDPDAYTVTYYTSAEDVIADNPVGTPNTFTTSGQMIYAVVTNTVTGCKTTIQFDLVVNPLPVPGTPTAAEQCGNSSGTAVFDLTEQTALILNDQSPTEFNVVYYTDAAATNEIPQPEAFISSGQTIYAYVYNSVTGCSAATQFNLILLPLPSLPTTTTFTGCSPFDLVAIAGEPSDMSSYSFFANEEDAINNSNAIADANRYIVGGNTGSVYIRVGSNEGCIQVAELFLEAGDCFIPRGISPNNDSMNDVFDLSGFGVNQIYIFNRYGQQVYSKSNYMAEWHGQADNDKELPTGTYYYMIKLSTGESRTGWVYVNRED